MRYSIRQVSATKWELVDGDGNVVGTFDDAPGVEGYALACAALGGIIQAALQVDAAGAPMMQDDSGLLPEEWFSPVGIAFSERLPGGRDFTNCAWSWRDPDVNMIPLLCLDETTEWGHLGAELAGFATEFSEAAGTVGARGRYFNSEVGMYARDLVAALPDGRTFPVSVDPTERIEVDYGFECSEWDDDGFCTAGEEHYDFMAYEIGGLTMCPIPGFENAGIANAAQGAQAATVRASALVPARPPLDWLTLDEPRIGQPFLGALGDDVLVEQRDGALACPWTMLDSGQVFGHLTYWGQCHVGSPWGPGVCASASPSSNGYADFLTGQCVCDDGTTIATGIVHVGCEHSEAMDVQGVRDAAAHAGLAFAQVSVIDGEFGPWLRGALLPTVTEDQLTVLRALTLSGEWAGELGAVIAVNDGGLPLRRVRTLAASNGARLPIPTRKIAASMKGGKLAHLIGGNAVGRCAECAQRAMARQAASLSTGAMTTRLAVLEGHMHTLLRRTRYMDDDAIAAELAAIKRP